MHVLAVWVSVAGEKPKESGDHHCFGVDEVTEDHQEPLVLKVCHLSKALHGYVVLTAGREAISASSDETEFARTRITTPLHEKR